MAIKKNADIEINEQIRDKEVRVIGANGDQLGVMSSKEAYMMAKDADLDLIKIAANATPPVVKIADFGKYRYEMMRKEKEAKKNQHVTEIKEIRMTPNIDTNDLNTKLSAARKFLEKGNKVKVALRFRGREMSRMNQSKYILDEFAEKLKDIAILDKPAKIEGRNMAIVISPKK
ncbi:MULTISPECIES: translation initiation factor IF-3 [unclassified Oribacterium]|uniref:translation initiation factor IF-3 n=1 Tax=unclassified Oribacterium TaxID=2629782 RepID=UPI000403D0E5|nr:MULTISPECIES: translation initiation factor IF-3 [unclassified Oribacterium]MBO5598058.1 translation initiation factor IF-3 [Oribacterium sp.]MBO6309439.1 translation initiation factor IF-3 [Oribacterium sp.]MBP3806158.1 translation initiation factor IF-3 [Oribacterium sp.]MBR1857205.1 translation initiation factor IF-3 [Oribacterium sp.]MCR5007533.1 translation initiation factor IF-3 [Oribacterium sp.]